MKRSKKTLKRLADAKIDVINFDSGVIRADDNSGRVLVSAANPETLWGDQGSVMFMIEGENTWFPMRMSPERMLALASLLEEKAFWIKEKNK